MGPRADLRLLGALCKTVSTQPNAKYVSSVARYAFNSFCSHVTRFELFLRRKGDRITINYHSCFPCYWPNSKTNLKWKQGGPLVFWGPYAACLFCVKGGSALVGPVQLPTLFKISITSTLFKSNNFDNIYLYSLSSHRNDVESKGYKLKAIRSI